MKKLLILLCSITLLSACQRQDVGLVSGGVVGAAAGNALTGGSAVGTAVGAVGGAYAGHELAK